MEKKKLNLKEIGLDKLIIIFIAGIFLIVLSFPNLFSSKEKTKSVPGSKISSGNSGSETEEEADSGSGGKGYAEDLEEKLKNVLKKLDGAGNVEVMITLKSSKELVTLKDAPYTQETLNETDGSGGTRISSSVSKTDESVLVQSDGESAPYVVKELEPEIEGVVVVAEGGGDQNIAIEIIDAVEVLFDVPAHKIKVMKMNTK